MNDISVIQLSTVILTATLQTHGVKSTTICSSNFTSEDNALKRPEPRNKLNQLLTINNISVTNKDYRQYNLRWDPPLVGESRILYTVWAEIQCYGKPNHILNWNGIYNTTITFDPSRREHRTWIFTVSASMDGYVFARGEKSYDDILPPGVPLLLSPPHVNFSHDCRHLTVNITAPNKKMRSKFLLYAVNLTSLTMSEPFYKTDNMKPDDMSTFKSIYTMAPNTVNHVCVKSHYRILEDEDHTSPIKEVCATLTCHDVGVNSNARSVNYAFIIVIAVAALGALILLCWSMQKYLKKHGTGQLPETIKQVIGGKVRYGDINTSDCHHYESLTKIEPVGYEDEPAVDAVTNENEVAPVSHDETESTTENMALLENGESGLCTENDGGSVTHRETILPMSSNDTDQSRSTRVKDFTNRTTYEPSDERQNTILNSQVENCAILPVSQKPENAETADYCDKNLSKHFMQNAISKDSSTFSDRINGGYILKTSR